MPVSNQLSRMPSKEYFDPYKTLKSIFGPDANDSIQNLGAVPEKKDAAIIQQMKEIQNLLTQNITGQMQNQDDDAPIREGDVQLQSRRQDLAFQYQFWMKVLV